MSLSPSDGSSPECRGLHRMNNKMKSHLNCTSPCCGEGTQASPARASRCRLQQPTTRSSWDLHHVASYGLRCPLAAAVVTKSLNLMPSLPTSTRLENECAHPTLVPCSLLLLPTHGSNSRFEGLSVSLSACGHPTHRSKFIAKLQ